MLLGISLSLNNLHLSGSAALASLIDLSQPISTGTADVWTQGASTRTFTVLTDANFGSARGGWSFLAESGVSYEVDYDVSHSGTPSGAFVRVVPDDQFNGGNAVAGSGTSSTSGTVSFTGSGVPLWVGPSLNNSGGNVLTINNLFVRKL